MALGFLRGGFVRLSAVLLLALAVSPFTAPFSACDLSAFTDRPVSHEGAGITVKTVDPLVASASTISIAIVVIVPGAVEPCSTPSVAARRVSLDIPLRL